MLHSSPTPWHFAQGPGAQWALSKCWRRGRLDIGHWQPVSGVICFNALGGDKQSRHGRERWSSDRGHSQLAGAGRSSQTQVLAKPFPGQLSCCSKRGLALPFWPLRSHCPPPSLSWPFFTEPWSQAQALCRASDDNDHPTAGSLQCSLESNCPSLCPSLRSLPVALHRALGLKDTIKSLRAENSIILGALKNRWRSSQRSHCFFVPVSVFSFYSSIVGIRYYSSFRCTINPCLYSHFLCFRLAPCSCWLE